jgi:hypothetical protein
VTVFGRRKFDRMQSPEEQYRASGRYEEEAQAARQRRADADVRQRASQRHEAEATAQRAKAARIRKVGEIRKIGPNTYETTGWEIDVTDGSVRGRVVENNVRHEGTLAGFTVRELCTIAHGPRCRRCV